jgi:protein-tyrosine phosphatase
MSEARRVADGNLSAISSATQPTRKNLFVNHTTREIVSQIMYNFAAASADETIVFGSARPGYSDRQVRAWIEFMQGKGITRVCCLLPEIQLNRYSNLLNTYRDRFGEGAILWTPIEDFHIVNADVFIDRILPFLILADRLQQKVVIHCSGGIGRTGHILAAWLVAGRGFDRQLAIATVRETGRNPYEALIAAPFLGRNPWRVANELQLLLDRCDRFNCKLFDI